MVPVWLENAGCNIIIPETPDLTVTGLANALHIKRVLLKELERFLPNFNKYIKYKKKYKKGLKMAKS